MAGKLIAGVPRQAYYKRCARVRARVVAAMRAPGALVAEVADRFDINPSTVYRACRESGLMVGTDGAVGGVANRARQNRRIASAVRKGLTVAHAVQRFNVSTAVVRAACRKHGVTPFVSRSRQRARSMKKRTAVAGRAGAGKPIFLSSRPTVRSTMIIDLLLRTDLTYAQIAEACGVSRQRVGQVLKKLQATRRGR